jgi:signal transduction histidine kinase
MMTPPTGTPAAIASVAPRRWVEPALILAFWTVMAALTAAGQVLHPLSSRLTPVVPAAAVIVAFANSYLWAAITPIVFRLSRRYPIEHANWHVRAIGFLALGAVLGGTVEVITSYLRFGVFFTGPWSDRPFNPFFGFSRLFWLDDLIVYLAILAVGFARDYFLRLQKRHDEAVLLQAQAARLKAQLAEARLSALRAQLDPHFLFNTLNAVSSLVGSDPRGVRRMITRLSALLRHSLEESAEPEVPLERELQVLTQYVEIMEIRFEGRLQFETRVQPDALDALVPNLILQPLVENAIKHGVGKLPGAAIGRIEVSARREDDVVVITVRDNGPTLEGPGELTGPEGVGLRNTRARLEQLYGSEHAFSLAPAPGGEAGVVATLVIPYHTRADLLVHTVETAVPSGELAQASATAARG